MGEDGGDAAWEGGAGKRPGRLVGRSAEGQVRGKDGLSRKMKLPR